MANPLATIAILSIGSMGAGVARLLVAHSYRVITNASDRRYVCQRSEPANPHPQPHAISATISSLTYPTAKPPKPAPFQAPSN
jgi:predicted dinucleotide-binding enzyme